LLDPQLHQKSESLPPVELPRLIEVVLFDLSTAVSIGQAVKLRVIACPESVSSLYFPSTRVSFIGNSPLDVILG
jgi:hypothetical protein